jgi:chromosomal replication initiator protein
MMEEAKFKNMLHILEWTGETFTEEQMYILRTKYISPKPINKIVTINHILIVVARYYNITAERVLTDTRKRECVQARQIAMSIAKYNTRLSLAAIGKEICHRTHATVLHAVKTVNNLRETDPVFNIEYEEILRRI